MKKISPSLLAADFANIEREVKKVAEAGADFLHLDIMDGHFVPNLTFGPPIVAAIKKVSTIPLDVHLMIEKPEKYVDEFIAAGSDYLTIHVESTEQTAELLKHIRAKGVKSGLTLRPRTPIESIKEFLPLCDLVLVMTVEPGFGGQSFMMDQLSKIDWLKSHRQQADLNYLIEVDGGVSNKTRPYLDNADVLVAGTYVFKNDYTLAIQSLR
ncbi:MAG: ribulose-phosphate 3-epimerase [Bdellovibrionaceae bacterium]|nr:ribulose-phosphate 3-epimerase [Pseudobdellovibrionaceae bacterium]